MRGMTGRIVPLNIRLGRDGLTWTNALAYHPRF